MDGSSLVRETIIAQRSIASARETLKPLDRCALIKIKIAFENGAIHLAPKWEKFHEIPKSVGGSNFCFSYPGGWNISRFPLPAMATP